MSYSYATDTPLVSHYHTSQEGQEIPCYHPCTIYQLDLYAPTTSLPGDSSYGQPSPGHFHIKGSRKRYCEEPCQNAQLHTSARTTSRRHDYHDGHNQDNARHGHHQQHIPALTLHPRQSDVPAEHRHQRSERQYRSARDRQTTHAYEDANSDRHQVSYQGGGYAARVQGHLHRQPTAPSGRVASGKSRDTRTAARHDTEYGSGRPSMQQPDAVNPAAPSNQSESTSLDARFWTAHGQDNVHQLMQVIVEKSYALGVKVQSSAADTQDFFDSMFTRMDLPPGQLSNEKLVQDIVYHWQYSKASHGSYDKAIAQLRCQTEERRMLVEEIYLLHIATLCITYRYKKGTSCHPMIHFDRKLKWSEPITPIFFFRNAICSRYSYDHSVPVYGILVHINRFANHVYDAILISNETLPPLALILTFALIEFQVKRETELVAERLPVYLINPDRCKKLCKAINDWPKTLSEGKIVTEYRRWFLEELETLRRLLIHLYCYWSQHTAHREADETKTSLTMKDLVRDDRDFSN